MRPRFVDAMQGTTIGVLMSATLPARLGEPSRALIVARRLGRPRESLPVVLGTLVSQTLLNLLALVILGAVMFSTVGLFAGRQQALLLVRARPDRDRAARCWSPRRCCAPGCRRAPRGVHRWVAAGAQATAARAAAASSSSAARARASAATVMQLGAWARAVARRATCCSWRSGSTATAPTSAPPRPCCSPSTSAPCCRSRRRTSASSRPRAWPCSPAPTASARPTRSATGSSCRPSRSPPR